MIRLACLFLLMASLAVAQNPEVNRYLAEARKALAGKDYPAAYDALTKAYAFHPYHQAILYNLGVMAAATGRPDESIPHLRKALHVNAGYKLDIPELATLKDRSDFQELLQLQKRLQTVVTHSDTAFVLKDRSLHVESLAIDRENGNAICRQRAQEKDCSHRQQGPGYRLHRTRCPRTHRRARFAR